LVASRLLIMMDSRTTNDRLFENTMTIKTALQRRTRNFLGNFSLGNFPFGIFFCGIAVAMTLSSNGLSASLVTNQAAARLGLERAWFTQIRVDPAQHKVVQWLLAKDQIFALTSTGTIQAIDAETGKTLWTTEVGNGNAIIVGMAVHSKHVAALSAGHLYLMDRADGHPLWSRQIGGAAAAAPALSNSYAYVVLMGGRIEGYPLDDPSAFVWQYRTKGRSFYGPTTTGKVVSWPAGRGLLYVGQAENPRVMFRVETNAEIVAPPAEHDSYLYVGSLDGYLYCFHELTGSERWRYATGFAITSSPAIIGERAFVASEGPTLHAVDALSGQPLWHVEGARQFVAVGNHHTYSMDRHGTLMVLDNESGVLAGRLATGTGNSALVNDQSDRIFLINDRGLVQCLHEIGASEPTWHRDTQEDATSDKVDQASEDSETKEAEATEKNPLPGDFEAEDDGADFGGFDDTDTNPFE